MSETLPQFPTVGRIVHYHSYGTPGGEFPSTARAAVVAAVPAPDDGSLTADLVVLNPEGLFFNHRVPFAETPTPGCWSWPPRV
jgi:hypothetical protein